MLKGQLTPGDSDMELRDPENHEDGDPEVRAGRRGKGRQRCRKTESEIDTRRDSEQTQRAMEETGKQKHQRPRMTQTQGYTARPRLPGK